MELIWNERNGARVRRRKLGISSAVKFARKHFFLFRHNYLRALRRAAPIFL